MTCPKCKNRNLNEFSVKKWRDRCFLRGIWFDAQELGRLLADDARQVASLRRGSVTELADGKKGQCPRDGAELMRVYSAVERSVIVDACAECRGIWLDGGEFQKLFAARRK